MSYSSLASQHESDQFKNDFDDLICGQKKGHMGHWEYNNSSMSLWNKFLQDNQQSYYIPKNEIEMIRKYSYLSSSLLLNEPVTFVSRGPGTLFHKKEAEIIDKLRNLKKIIYIDTCDKALSASVAGGKNIRSDCTHQTLHTDFYDPHLRYSQEGVQLNVSFGLTLLNVWGDPAEPPPAELFIKNMKNIRQQLSAGDHFITIFDHNEDTASIEKAYAKQEAFAKTMLVHFNCLDPSAVDFHVQYFPSSCMLAHGYKFKRDYILPSSEGPKVFYKGDILWFNNSFKPRLKDMRNWIEESGFKYALPNIPMDTQERLGWHHIIAA